MIRHGELVTVKINGKRHWRIINKHKLKESISFYIELYQLLMDRETFYRFVLNNAPTNCILIFTFNKLLIPVGKIDDIYFITYEFYSKQYLNKKNTKLEEKYVEKWLIDHGFKHQAEGIIEDNMTYMKTTQNDRNVIIIYTDSIMLLGQFIKLMADDYYKEEN